MSIPYLSLLKQRGLKDTMPRRSVLNFLSEKKKPVSITEILRGLQREHHPIGIVTIYRILDALQNVGLIHKHNDGTFSLCSLPDLACDHILLHCTSCGSMHEEHDHELCKREEIFVKRFRFLPTVHTRELVGVCSHCRS